MASPSDNPLKRLIREIHRRSLWQVLGIYLVGGWIAYEIVQSLTEGLGLPEWFPAFAVVLLIIADVGSPPVDAPPSATSSLFTWRKAFGGGVLAFALWGVVAAGWVLFGGAIGEAPGRGDASVEPSVAVMPCTDLSPTGDQAALAQGLAEGVITALAQIPDLKVIGINSVIALLEENADVGTVAQRLDVATVLECSLQQAGDVIRIRPTLDPEQA